ncbi:hypothetical protein Z948_1116 [Sulfitobacter donghicola DSW-25 = KCTC 12864 = JCM 14565]|nr:hypothetical protein Z948_1116 [Sulfitobacter donghicola DSW-25 = KCTC 12864 = JCM 14565]
MVLTSLGTVSCASDTDATTKRDRAIVIWPKIRMGISISCFVNELYSGG